MKDRALEIAASTSNQRDARNLLREYLQHVILRELFDTGALETFVFHGGTALRMLHDLPRFSVDLDFHLAEPDPEYNLEATLEQLNSGLVENGYDIDRSDRLTGNVKSSFIKFRGLLNEANLSPHPDENLTVKIELDINPPEGVTTDRSFLSDHFPMSLLHHDQSSFLAGKLHAILQRDYVKGRDYFDLMFYMDRWEEIEPNVEYLRNALDQTGYEGPEIKTSTWKSQVQDVVRDIDWDQVTQDVERLVERKEDLQAFQKEHLVSLLETGN